MLVLAEQAAAEFFTFSMIVAPTNTVTGGGVTITLTPGSVNTPGDNLDGTAPGTDIVFGSISVTGLTLSSVLEPINIPYSFQVSVSNYLSGTDVIPTGPPVVFNISGVLTGSVGGGKKLNIANSFTFNTITQDVGGELYQFSLFSYVPPAVLPVCSAPTSKSAYRNQERLRSGPGRLMLGHPRFAAFAKDFATHQRLTIKRISSSTRPSWAIKWPRAAVLFEDEAGVLETCCSAPASHAPLVFFLKLLPGPLSWATKSAEHRWQRRPCWSR